MAELLLGRQFETTGHWYLPETPEAKSSGTLVYAPPRITLRLDDAFRPLHGTLHFTDDERYPIVHGITRDADRVTLLNSFRSQVSVNFRSGEVRQPETLTGQMLIIGSHVSTESTYRESHFRVPGLQIWLSRQLNFQSISPSTDSSPATFSFQSLRVPEEIVSVPSIGAEIKFGISTVASTDPYLAIRVETFGWFRVCSEIPKSLQWHLSQMDTLTTLLTFAAGTSMSPDQIVVRPDPEDELSAGTVLLDLQNSEPCAFSSHHNFLLPRSMLTIELHDIIRRWFDLRPKVHEPSQLARSVISSMGLWLHVSFLSLIQSLEGFHRALHDGTYMQLEEYSAVEATLKEAISPSVGASHRAALESKIRYGNEFALARRLRELAELLSPDLRKIIFGDYGEIPRSWIDTRNYYTHWDVSLRSNILTGQDMVHANLRMRLLIRVLYLSLVGVSQETLLRALRGANSEAQWLRQINAM